MAAGREKRFHRHAEAAQYLTQPLGSLFFYQFNAKQGFANNINMRKTPYITVTDNGVFRSQDCAQAAIFHYIMGFDNHTRRHSTLAYETPSTCAA